MMMIKTYAIRPFTSVALKKSSAPAPQADPPPLINVDEIDVVDGQIDKFKDAAKTHAAASVQDPGCREFDIVVSQTKSNHVLLLSAFDDAAALEAHQASDHYKAYLAATKSIISMSTAMPLSSVAVLTKVTVSDTLIVRCIDQLAGAPGCLSGWARAKASICDSALAIREKFANGAVSTAKNFAPAAWLARQMSASVMVSPWQ